MRRVSSNEEVDVSDSNGPISYEKLNESSDTSSDDSSVTAEGMSMLVKKDTVSPETVPETERLFKSKKLPH